MLAKTDVFDVKRKVQQGTKRSSGPKTDLFTKNKEEGAETKNAVVKKLSSFIWTFMLTKEIG